MEQKSSAAAKIHPVRMSGRCIEWKNLQGGGFLISNFSLYDEPIGGGGGCSKGFDSEDLKTAVKTNPATTVRWLMRNFMLLAEHLQVLFFEKFVTRIGKWIFYNIGWPLKNWRLWERERERKKSTSCSFIIFFLFLQVIEHPLEIKMATYDVQ